MLNLLELDFSIIENGVIRSRIEEFQMKVEEVEANISEISEKCAEKYAKADELSNEEKEIKQRNVKGRSMLDKLRGSKERLLKHVSLQINRATQLASFHKTSKVQLEMLLTSFEDVTTDLNAMKSQLKNINVKILSQLQQTADNASFLESAHCRAKNEKLTLIQQSRAKDATIHANETELKSIIGAINKQKETLTKTSQQCDELERNIKQTDGQLRMVANYVESLRSDRKNFETEQQAVQKFELMKSNLRKEIEYHKKTSRKLVVKQEPQTQNTQPVEKNTQQNYATNLSVNASTSASASAPAPAPSGQQDEEPMEDFMRDILMIKPLTKESNVLNNTLSMSSDISNYSIDSINNR